MPGWVLTSSGVGHSFSLVEFLYKGLDMTSFHRHGELRRWVLMVIDSALAVFLGCDVLD